MATHVTSLLRRDPARHLWAQNVRLRIGNDPRHSAIRRNITARCPQTTSCNPSATSTRSRRFYLWHTLPKDVECGAILIFPLTNPSCRVGK